MEDEEVPMVDGVFEGAFEVLGDKTWFVNESSSRCHGGLWWLIMDEEDDEVVNLIRSESGILDFDGAIQLDTVQLKKSTDIVESRKIGMIWSLSLLGICKRCKISFIRENGLTIIWDSENLTELCE
ncbi:hypothetical protein Tco_0622254 [Tanacetum coccineum]